MLNNVTVGSGIAIPPVNQQKRSAEIEEREQAGSELSNIKLEQESLEIDPAEEKRVIRKVDLRVIPILFLLFLFAFVDRYVGLCFSVTK